jgi:hypothetical protein
MTAVGRDLPSQGQGEDRGLEQGNGKPEWKPGEDTLRKSEVRWGKVSVVVHGLVALIAVGAVYVGIKATNTAKDAVDTAREGTERQTSEDRLSTAIGAIGGDQPGERVGGLAMLRRHVGSQLSAANSDDEGSDEERRQKGLDALLLYTAALDVFENYLRNPPDDQADADGGLGYGMPDVPADNAYAAKELREMMRLRSEVEALDIDSALSPAPTLDLAVDVAKVQLRGQSWAGIDFAWLNGHYFRGIDLRSANLADSRWGESSLQKAFLQCADLDGAKFIGTKLRGADLRGANISDADFSDAKVARIKLDRVYYAGDRPPKGLPKLPPITQQGEWEGPQKCIRHRQYDTKHK